ncbi:hypothetical protein B0H14DRAFT_2607965 [Mycena olivaceomarginata]|nr:hypothetical protein B0H14DRAFT_2607965 [Mycena olivaceomarginata]
MSVSQDLLLIHLAWHDIPVTWVSVDSEKASLMIRPLKALPHIRISTQLSSDSRVKRLALSTYDMILLISVDSNAQSWMKMQGTALAELLLGGPMFVGFGIAHITLQIYCDIRAHFSNTINLSALCYPSTRETWAPSKLVGTRLWSATSLLKINCLWHGGGGDESSEREVALQAWISAIWARQELTLLGNLMLHTDTLAVHKPKEISNDFIQGVMTAEGMKLENAQYQNSVQESSDFSQQVLIRPYHLVLFGYNTYM